MTQKTILKQNFMNNILDDVYHSQKPVCEIIQTNVRTRKQDIFDKYRPRKGACVDYNISQTDTKLDAGDTKIHVQQTEAEYFPYLAEVPPPPPPKVKKIKYFNGVSPKWQFLHEIQKKKVDEQQKTYREEFARRLAMRKSTERKLLIAKHRRVTSLAGPTWYQELSPKQMRAVDDLKVCMQKDFVGNVICHTQECIAKLGVLPRPKVKHIEKSLNNCCQCPVEFLLILYQLIDPRRTKYSINDRLLLSAVVHLTLKNTLRELHIRIPSPPAPQKVVKNKPKKKKQKHYDSPYLEPYTFERESPKFTGVYYNKHMQYPESPYFDYLDDLRKCLKSGMNIPRSEHLKVWKSKDKEIDEETKLAQSIYEQLVNYSPVRQLLKPSRYSPCYNFRNDLLLSINLKGNIPYSLDEEKITCPCKAGFELNQKGRKRQIGNKAKRKKQTLLIGGVKETVEGPVFVITGLLPATEREVCVCWQDYELFQKRKELVKAVSENDEKFIVSGVTNTKDGPILILSGIQPQREQKEEVDPIREQLVSTMIEKKKKFAIEGVVDTSEGPVFLLSQLQPGMEWGIEDENSEKVEEKNSEKICFCSEDFESSTISVCSTASTSSVSECLKKPCTCLTKSKKEQESQTEEKKKEQKLESEESIVSETQLKQEGCRCKQESRKFINTPHCSCEQCDAERKRKTLTYVIRGLKTEESNSVVRVIDSVSTEQPCKCLQKYEKAVGDYENFQKRKELVLSSMEGRDKFIVGGVSTSPIGPVFIHGGLQPKLECVCAEEARKQEAEKLYLARMPQILPGRNKYGIGGVKETPHGNVYIINNALPIGECGCMKVYNQFKEVHTPCLNLYDEYVSSMNEEVNKFVEEMKTYANDKKVTKDSDFDKVDLELKELKQFSIDQKEEPMSVSSVESLDLSLKKSCVDTCTKQEPVECKDCTCSEQELHDEACFDCECVTPESDEEELSIDINEQKEKRLLKRFFIYKKIRCNRGWQIKVLKKALKSMADDGYPLAKLPECYKLPHFWLWMNMRCGTFWTQEDRYKSVLVSKCWWRHIDGCSVRNIRSADIGISKKQAKLLDWSKAAYVRKLIRKAKYNYYRSVRQLCVNFGREFFPCNFEYEFPFRTFRDCYFSYCASKEEDVLAVFVWQPHEYNNVADLRRYS